MPLPGGVRWIQGIGVEMPGEEREKLSKWLNEQ